MANRKVSTLNDDWAASLKALCSCDRGTTSLFYCNVETCPDHEQTIFCNDCIVIDEKHMHKRVLVKQELETRMNEWKVLVENV
jgi:hypothetical protein